MYRSAMSVAHETIFSNAGFVVRSESKIVVSAFDSIPVVNRVLTLWPFGEQSERK
jgi:hypothetical protein